MAIRGNAIVVSTRFHITENGGRCGLTLAIVVAFLFCIWLCGCAQHASFSTSEGKWSAAAFGSQTTDDDITVVDSHGVHEDVLGDDRMVALGSARGVEKVIFHAGQSGEISDDDDGFQFFYTQVDPMQDNFKIKATFRIVEMGERAGNQSGFGVCATDAAGFVESDGSFKAGRYFNSVGAYVMADPNAPHACMKGVWGYDCSDSSIVQPMRRCEDVRDFDAGVELVEDATFTVELLKGDDGFQSTINGQEVSLVDHGFVAVQDSEHAYVGVMAAKNVTVEVTDLRYETSPVGSDATIVTTAEAADDDAYATFGPLEKTPIAEVLQHSALVFEPENVVHVSPEAPDGATGTEDDPMKLSAAVAAAQPGAGIVLAPGSYVLDGQLACSAHGSADAPIVLRGEEPGSVKVEGGLVVDGSWWLVEGLEVCSSAGVGIQVCGDSNVISRCEVHGCADTGIQVSSGSSLPVQDVRAMRDQWPCDNLVVNCDSHDNCDPSRQDADGFAAKVSCGSGNVFYGCVAANNVDDGFDLYAKSSYGPIGAVRIENCIAYGNGHVEGDTVNGDGNGFKLGGGALPGGHLLCNSLAFYNTRCGATSNSCPDCEIRDCTFFDNRQNVMLYARDGGTGSWGVNGLVSVPGISTELETQLNDGYHGEDNLIIAREGLSSRELVRAAEETFVSTDPGSISRDQETGELTMGQSFVARDGIDAGARF